MTRKILVLAFIFFLQMPGISRADAYSDLFELVFTQCVGAGNANIAITSRGNNGNSGKNIKCQPDGRDGFTCASNIPESKRTNYCKGEAQKAITKLKAEGAKYGEP